MEYAHFAWYLLSESEKMLVCPRCATETGETSTSSHFAIILSRDGTQHIACHGCKARDILKGKDAK